LASGARFSIYALTEPHPMNPTQTEITPENTRIGWIGTGVMGASMCRHLMHAGYQTTLFNRTKAKAQPLIDLGAGWVDNPAQVAAASDIVFTIVGFPNDVKQTLLGDDGVLSGLAAGGTIVDMTTSQPALAQEIAAAAAAKNCSALDAPVSGGDVGARGAALSIMVGGPKDEFHRLLPLFSLMGRTIQYQGLAGSGQHTKMVNQILIATGMIGVCEALLYGFKAGLNLESVLKSVSAGAAGSWSLSNMAPRLLKGDYQPGFFIEHFIKDMGIALEEAKRMNLSLPGLSLAEQLYLATAAQGHSKSGTQALLLALATLSNVDWKEN